MKSCYSFFFFFKLTQREPFKCSLRFCLYFRIKDFKGQVSSESCLDSTSKIALESRLPGEVLWPWRLIFFRANQLLTALLPPLHFCQGCWMELLPRRLLDLPLRVWIPGTAPGSLDFYCSGKLLRAAAPASRGHIEDGIQMQELSFITYSWIYWINSLLCSYCVPGSMLGMADELE
jgi:hypothetical protein